MKKIILILFIIPNLLFSQNNIEFNKLKNANSIIKEVQSSYANFPDFDNLNLQKKIKSENKIKLDSLIQISHPIIGDSNFFKQVYKYDSLGNVIYFELLEKQNSNNWERIDLIVDSFDINSNLVLRKWYVLNTSLNIWYNYNKAFVTYNSANKIINILYYTYNNANNTFEPFAKKDYLLDSLNNYIEENDYIYNSFWELTNQHFWDYNANNNLVEYIYKIKNGNSLVNNLRTKLLYDSNNVQTAMIIYNWHNIDSIWFPDAMDTLVFDSLNRLIKSYRYGYDTTILGNWENRTLQTYQYNDSDIVERYTYSGFGINGWEINQIEDYTIDINNNILKWDRYLRLISGQLTKINSHSYSYDYSIYTNELFVPNDYTSTNLILIDSVERWNSDGIYNGFNINKFFYDNYTGIENINEKSHSFNIYPNPANNYLTIDVNKETNTNFQIEIFDITGKLLYSHVFQNNNIKILTDEFENGLYIIVIKSSEIKISRKLIVNH